MPDGTGYIANRLPMPCVTVEMMEWWFAWFAMEDLRYKLWYSPQHFAISISDKDRARALDESLPMSKRRLRTEYVIENTNGPCDEKIAISFMDAEMFGFDMSRFHPPGPAPLSALMAHRSCWIHRPVSRSSKPRPAWFTLSARCRAASNFAPGSGWVGTS